MLRTGVYKLYVGASRARHASRIGLHGPAPPEFLRALLAGPEAHVVAELARLRDRATKTRPKVDAIARAMGWAAPGAHLTAWRAENGVVEHPCWGTAYRIFTKCHPPIISIVRK